MGFEGEADDDLAGLQGGEFAEDVRCADHVDDEFGGGLLDLAGMALGGAVIADRCGHNDCVRGVEVLDHGVAHLLGGDNVDPFGPFRRGQGHGPGDEGRLITGADSGGGHGEAHLAARRIAEKTDVVEVFARGAGRYEDVHAAVKHAIPLGSGARWPAFEHPAGRLEDDLRLHHASLAGLAGREPALGGSD